MDVSTSETRKPKKNKGVLLDIYLNFFTNRLSMILFFISLLALGLILLFMNDMGLSSKDYLLEKESINYAYLSNSLLVMEVFNIIFIGFLSLFPMNKGLNGFEAIFLAREKRGRVYFARTMAIYIYFVCFLILEFLIFLLIGIIQFPGFVFYEGLINILFFNILSGTALYTILLNLLNAMPNFFMGLLCTLTYWVVKVILDLELNNEIITKVFGFVFPIPKMIIRENTLEMEAFYGIIYLVVYILFLWYLSFLCYRKKDINC